MNHLSALAAARLLELALVPHSLPKVHYYFLHLTKVFATPLSASRFCSKVVICTPVITFDVAQ